MWEKPRHQDELESRFPLAGEFVSGLRVREHIPNEDSISASLDEYMAIEGVREVKISWFSLSGKHYSAKGTQRISNLAKEIETNQEINPLIVVIDDEGPYILEGGTRAESLFKLRKESFPALVVIDLDVPVYEED